MMRFIFTLFLGVTLGIYLQDFPEINQRMRSILPDRKVIGEKLSNWGDKIRA